MVGLTSRPSYGHLLWKMRVLLRREDVFQHPIARRLPAWQQPYLSHLKRSSVASFQREQEALEGRKEGLQGECYVLPPSRAVGGQELPWAVAMLPILPTCEMSQVFACCVQDVRWTHRSLCAFCPFFTSWEKFAGIGHHSTGSMGSITVSSCSYKGDFGFSVSFPDSTESEFEWILAVIFYSFAFWLHFSCACFSTLVPCFAQA